MRNLIIPIIAIASLSLASCKKERTCTCNVTETANGVGSSYTSAQTVDRVTKKTGKRLTDCYSATQKRTETYMGTVYNIETTIDCELK